MVSYVPGVAERPGCTIVLADGNAAVSGGEGAPALLAPALELGLADEGRQEHGAIRLEGRQLPRAEHGWRR